LPLLLLAYSYSIPLLYLDTLRGKRL